MEHPVNTKLSVIQEETLEDYEAFEKAFAALTTYWGDDNDKTVTPENLPEFSSLAEESPAQDTTYMYLLSPTRLSSSTKYGYEMTLAELATGASGINPSYSEALSVINATKTGDLSILSKTTDTNTVPQESKLLKMMFRKCKGLNKELEESRRLNKRLLEKYNTTNQQLVQTKQALKRYQEADKKNSDMILQFLGKEKK